VAASYDVIVVGAGPAGLITAWKAAEKGLKVLLVEKKSSPAEAVRTTGNAFKNRSPINGEMVSVSKKNDRAVIHFHNSNFDIEYSGRLIDAYDRYSFSNSGYCVQASRSDYPQQYFYDMSVLQGDLLKKALQAGADIMTGCLAIGAENEKTRMRLHIKHHDTQSVFSASRLIAADGLNSRLAESMGLNKQRPVMVRGPVLEMVYKGVDFPYPPGFAFIVGSDMKGGDGFMFAYPHAAEENAYAVMVNCRFPAAKCLDRIKHFTTKSKFASWFAHARHIHSTAAMVTVRPPIKKPVIGNVLFIGDAAAYGETLVAGAMFCGFHAADAVCRELAGDNGFDWYCDLWASNFDFVANPQKQKDYTKILRLYGSLPDDDLDFLFRLSQERGPIDMTGQGKGANEYSGGNVMIDYFLGFSEVKGELRSRLQDMRNS
jgi:digeranylgeranylglycerophospholipid reductase